MEIPKYVSQFRKELKLKNYGDKTIDNYSCQIGCFLKHFSCMFTEPSKINEQAIKDYLLTSTSINHQRSRHSAIKLFYKLVIRQPMKFKYIEYARKDRKLPIVLSESEIQSMFNVCQNLKHKAIFALMYACGLRVSEVINLRPEHIDSKRMVINIIQAKGKKDRQVMLPESLLLLLRKYYAAYKPSPYLFVGQSKEQYSPRSINEMLKSLADKAGVDNKRIYAHLIRHCSFTHMLERGTELSIIQKVAGHSSIKTTQGYTHISANLISRTYSPLEAISL